MNIQTLIARLGGQTWRSYNMVSIWFYPAIIIGKHSVQVTSDDYRCLTRYLQPGDFLISQSEPYILSNLGIAGTAFKHLAVYTGAIRGTRDPETGFILKPRHLGINYKHTGEPPYGIYERSVTHAIGEGVVTQDLMEITNHVDYIASVRPWTTKEQQHAIVDAAIQTNGLDYNFDFKPTGPKSLYCTQLGEYCCKKAGINPPDKTLIRVNWKGFILWWKYKELVPLADNFTKFPMICNSMSCDRPRFFKQSLLTDQLRLAIQKSNDATTEDSVAEPESDYDS